MSSRVVMPLAGAALFAVGCANGLGATGTDSVAELIAAPTADACVDVLDAPALGLAPPRLQAGRGKDLEAWTAQLDAALATQAAAVAIDPVAAAPADDAGEVAGHSACAHTDWPWLTVEGGQVRRLRPTADVASSMHEGQRALEAGRAPEARVAWARAARAGKVPAPALAIARSYLVEGRPHEAVAAYSALLERFAGNPLVHAGLGDALRQAERRGDAADAWGRGIALWPREGRMVRRVASDPFIEAHPLVPPPARRLRDGRWVLTAGKPGPRSPELLTALQNEAQIYAGCKERFRQDSQTRAAIAGLDAGSPWLWSPIEESACTALWLRAYQRNRETGRLEDASLDDLLTVARAGFLDARALFDVGAFAHPLATALLTREERDQLFAFVAAHRMVRRRQGGWLF